MAKLDKFITYAYLRDEVDIPQNIPEEELDHPIKKAQDTVRLLMGDEFYQDYLTAYKANTMSAVYTTLFPYIKQFMAWQAYYEWIFKANFKPTRSGFRIHIEQNSQAASDQQMGAILNKVKYDVERYKKTFVEYMNSHNTDYPLYSTCCSSGLTGNAFHISAVKNKTAPDEPYGVRITRYKSW